MRPTVRLMACCTAALALGCSSRFEDAWSRARPKTFACTGTVEHRGLPVAGALVNFAIDVPDASRPQVVHTHQAVGFTGPDGAFRLKTFREGDGAVAGTHRVRIAMPLLADPAAPGGAQPPAVLPDRFGSFEASGLAAEVTPDGPNHFVFELGG